MAPNLTTQVRSEFMADMLTEKACTPAKAASAADGGRLIDSSPMYGSSQATIGCGLNKLGKPPALFSADKVWASPGRPGPRDLLRRSRKFAQGRHLAKPDRAKL